MILLPEQRSVYHNSVKNFQQFPALLTFRSNQMFLEENSLDKQMCEEPEEETEDEEKEIKSLIV